MKHSCLNSKWILFIFFHGILLLFMSSSLKSARIPASAVESDRLALLDLKKRISEDPLQIMSSWNDSTHFCNWFGVTCNPSSKRVIILNLQDQRLAGTLTPYMGNLTYLTSINLKNNSFYDEIPQELGRLRHLQNLSLRYNSFGGNLPSNLSHCTQLRVLDVVYNKLVGQIPEQFSSLSNLVYLVLDVNNLTGSIPAWIGNFSSLSTLSLSRNNLQGSIPSELGRLLSLEFFSTYANNLSGTIPPLIYNISSIYYFCVTQNQLHGSLPPDVGLTLPNLEVFLGGLNSFTGPIPTSLSNASRLQSLDFGRNGLTGSVPQNLARLSGLVRLNFDDNRLGNGKVGDLNFLGYLANCTSLEALGLSNNQFGGVLPNSIANLSFQLKELYMAGNMIHGGIPMGIGNLVNLTDMGLDYNYLGGHLPDTLGKLSKLQLLYLHNNQFSGPIPSSLGNLTKLLKLFMENNRFGGSIPTSLGNCQDLLQLNLHGNNLNGTIPKQVIGLSSIAIYLVLSNNSLTGTLPFEVGNLKMIGELDLSENRLSGEIPSSLGNCVSLVHLYLEGNSFEGAIPPSLKTLRGLEEIDLSRNNLSGQIPEFLSKFLSLNYLNLSHNDFEGNVPSEGIFSNESAISIFGNEKLCGGVPELLLPKCFKKRTCSSLKCLALKVVIPIIFVLALLCFSLTCCMVKKWRKRPIAASSLQDRRLTCISYAELHASTNGFSGNNLIGSGSFGSVYKGVLSSNGAIVAVKVLNVQQRGASKSFIDECNALRSLRHRNLLKIITTCSSIDHQGNEFKSLIFEFMSNGSLDQWLHPIPIEDENHEYKRLSFIQRLNIAMDVAYALEYLHLHCETPIVHCDVKPSNVLLNEDMVAHVGDFGLAKFVFEESDNPSKNQTMSNYLSTTLKGSIGYIPPEYGMGGQVSVLGDIYSFGILLLEMFIGKKPTDDIFKDGLSIHKFTTMALPECVMDIVDSSMPFGEDGEDDETNNNDIEESAIVKEVDRYFNARSRVEDCLVSVLQIGLLCSATSPHERLPTNEVVNKLRAIRDMHFDVV